VQDALGRAGRADTILSDPLGAHLAVVTFGRFNAAHGVPKLGDRAEPHGRRGFEHAELAPVKLYDPRQKRSRLVSATRFERLLDGFEPDFDFVPAPRIAEAEFAQRIERITREATINGYDATLVHADDAPRFATSNGFLRYTCDWEREGILIIPTDEDHGLQLISFFTESAVLPPAGEAVGVEAIWQISPLGREYAGRPGNPTAMTAQACARTLRSFGYESGSFGVMGDESSWKYWDLVLEELPKARIFDAKATISQMQHVRSVAEQAQLRSAAQLIDIGYQAMCHVLRPGVTDREMYAAFTFAQMARGGEWGDGYQIGVNQWGTHVGKPYGHVVRPGDLINLYASAVTYHGYTAQSARMMAVGEISAAQETTLEMCTDAVRRAERLIRPGVRFSELHQAAFSAYIERGYLKDDTTKNMPWNWAANEDGSPRRVREEYVPDEDYERQGRRLGHVYPASVGPHNPNLGHEVGTPGFTRFNVTSHNTDRAEAGNVFVLHAQWLDPLSSGANIGDCYLVTETGFENLTCHTDLATYRVAG
jgi:Xaa-Pro aminopeptidase